MKSNKPSLSKAVKAVTKTITKSTAAVAGKFKRSAKAAPASAQAAAEPPAVKAPAPEPASIAEPKAKRKSAARKAPLEVPAILLEGDQPSAPPASGPGQRYSLGPVPPARPGIGEREELPEAYGTKQLLLTARDPHWLYASWDLTRKQQRDYNAASADKHLVVRIFRDKVQGEPFVQVHVQPESTHWFIHVGDAGTKYLGELGYYGPGGKWQSISTSGATMTPPDSMSADTAAQFATIPIEVPFERLQVLAAQVVRQSVPLAEVLVQLRAAGHAGFSAAGSAPGRWTPEQAQALASIITMDSVRRVWMGSLEITELIRRRLQQDTSSMAAAQFSLPTSPGMAFSSVSSPFGGAEQRKGFWFNVNAELIIYGATEPDATVTIGGRAIKLRGDGTFSYRFSLPDGHYELPAVAVSADKTDARAAELRFSRATDYRGDVGMHPQDPQLKAPLVAHVA